MPGAATARAVLRIALAAVVLAVFVHTRADPDLWGHVRFGQDLVASRGVPIADRYSFDSDRAWVNHEWLAEIVMYGSYAAAGGAGLIALKVLLLIAMAAAAVVTVRRAGIGEMPHDLLIGLLLIGTVPQASHVRPQLFSLALFAWMLAALVAADRDRSRPDWRALIALPLLLVLWVNLHGGWIVGAGVLVAWTIVSIAWGRSTRRRAIVLAAAAFGSVVATLANPHGWRMWAFLRETVGLGRADIVDWQPVYRLGAPYLLIWMLVAAAAGAAVWWAVRARRLEPQAVAVVAMLGVASFKVNRLLAFFAIAVVMLLHREIASVVERWRRDAVSETAAGSLAAVAIGVLLIAGSAAAAARNATCVRIDPADYPEPQAIAAIDDARLRGRMLTWFGWGEYAIWHLAPDVSVSIDGRRETAYSDAIIQRHLRFYFVPGERDRIADAMHADLVWVPADLGIAASLSADGWHTVFSGDRSVLLTRHDPGPPRLRTILPSSGPRCFPGP